MQNDCTITNDANHAVTTNIDIGIALRVAQFATREDHRRSLRFVAIDTVGDAVRYVATDGHRLTCAIVGDTGGAAWDSEGRGERLLPADAIAGVKSPKPAKRGPTPSSMAEWTNDTLRLPDGSTRPARDGAMVRLQPGGKLSPDFKFPEWRQVVPPPGRGDGFPGLNMEYVSQFQKASAARSLRPSRWSDEVGAVLYETTDKDGVRWYGIVMPVRL